MYLNVYVYIHICWVVCAYACICFSALRILLMFWVGTLRTTTNRSYVGFCASTHIDSHQNGHKLASHKHTPRYETSKPQPAKRNMYICIYPYKYNIYGAKSSRKEIMSLIVAAAVSQNVANSSVPAPSPCPKCFGYLPQTSYKCVHASWCVYFWRQLNYHMLSRTQTMCHKQKYGETHYLAGFYALRFASVLAYIAQMQ